MPFIQSLGVRTLEAMRRRKFTSYLWVLMGTIFFLLIANLSLFLRIIQLQEQVMLVLQPLQISRGLEVGAKAPDFKLKNTQGQVVSLNNILNNIHNNELLIVFSSTTCPACQKFWPILNKFAQTHPEVNVLMISRGSDDENKKMVIENNFDFPIIAWDEKIAQDYKVPGTPFLYLLSKEQKIIFAGFANEMEKLDAVNLAR